MTYELTVRRVAELDVTDAFEQYEKSEIERNPLQYQLIHRELRRALVRRFPYSIFYLLEENHIIVTAVLHARSNPAVWDDRT